MLQHDSITTNASRRQKSAAVATLTIVGGSLVVNGQPVQGASFEVTSAVGNTADDGTLRHAIEQAALNPGPDTITFAPALDGQTITLNNVLYIFDDVEIVGGGEITLTNGAGEIFYIYGTGALTMSGITLDGADEEAIQNRGTLDLTDVDITGSGTSAIIARGTAVDTSLTSVTVTGSATDAVVIESGDVTIIDSDVSDNDADGVHVEVTTDVDVTITGGNFDRNGRVGVYLYTGAAPSSARSATVSGATMSDNSDSGALLFNFGEVELTDLEVARNNAGPSDEGALVVYNATSAALDGITATDNHLMGLHLYETLGDLSVSNVTVSGSGLLGFDIYGNDTVSLYNITAVGNGALDPADRDDAHGIWVMGTAQSVTAQNIHSAGNLGGGMYINAVGGYITVDGFTDEVTLDGTDHLGNGWWGIGIDTVDGQSGDGVGADIRNVEIHGEFWLSSVTYLSIVDDLDVTLDADSNNAQQGSPYPQVAFYSTPGDIQASNITITGSAAEALEVFDASGVIEISNLTITGAGEAAINVDDSDDVTFTNITVADNDVAGDNVVRVDGSTAVIEHSTISANTSSGAVIGVVDAASDLTLSHTIVAGNDGQDALEAFAGSTVTTAFNLVETGSLDTVGTNVETTDPALGPLADNGGTTFTMLPNAGSPAIDAGDPNISSEPATDQRGGARIVPTDSIDIGSVEVDGGEVSIEAATVAENAGSVDVVVTRTGGADGPASMGVFTSSSGTAQPGTDFVSTEATVTWAAGESGPKTVTVPILVDQLIEGDETIVMSLSDPVGTRFGSTDNVTITDVVGPAVTSLAPQRFADTRPNGETFDDVAAKTGKVAPAGEIDVQITGRGGVPDDAVGVVMNVTAIGAEANGYVTAHPCADPRPLTSSLNYTPGVNLGNEVIAGLSDDGTVCLFTSSSAHLAVDVVGYIAADSPLINVAPARVLDTRSNGETIDGEQQGDGITTAGGSITLPVGGRANVPSDAAAVIVNVTAIGATGNGYVTVTPCVDPLPTASSLNHVAGVNRGNELVASLNDDGELCLFTSAAINLTVDVVGYIPAGSNYSAIEPARFLDTRDDTKLAAGDEVTLQVAGVGEVPTTATAAVVNVTAIAADGTGFVTVHPCENPRPLASSLNYVAGVNGGNEVIAQLDDDGALCLYTSAGAHLTVDVVAYLS